MADARMSRAGSSSALVTVATSIASMPSSIHIACRRVRVGALLPKSLTSAGAPALSPRSTSSRCAVSRRQPFGCDSVSINCAVVHPRHRRTAVARRRLVHHAIDAAEPGRQLEIALFDLIAEIFGDVAPLLNDAAVHVDDIERAVRGVAQIDGAEPLVGGREEVGFRVRLTRLHRRAVVVQRAAGRRCSRPARR